MAVSTLISKEDLGIQMTWQGQDPFRTPLKEQHMSLRSLILETKVLGDTISEECLLRKRTVNKCG
jgi:hypothetical protein